MRVSRCHFDKFVNHNVCILSVFVVCHIMSQCHVMTNYLLTPDLTSSEQRPYSINEKNAGLRMIAEWTSCRIRGGNLVDEWKAT